MLVLLELHNLIQPDKHLIQFVCLNLLQKANLSSIVTFKIA